MMPTIQLAEILRELSTTSVRELFHRTGSSERSVFKQAQIAAIDSYYRKNKGFRGQFGFPVSEVKFTGHTAVRNFSGGTVKFLTVTPQGEDLTVVRVRFVGFHCIERASDQFGSPTNEPYFVIGVAAANGSRTTKFGPYDSIDHGSDRFEAAQIVTVDQGITPPIVLGVVAAEHDHGSTEEAEEKVRKVFEEIEKKFDQAIGSFTGAPTDTHVMPEWARDIMLGWAVEGVVALFGLGDDAVGKTPVVLFDNNADLMEWRAPAVIGKHGSNDYNVVVHVGGQGEGEYDLFFLVDLWDIARDIKRREEAR